MNTLALVLVLVSAVFHATWNLFAKRTNGGATFVWLYDILSVIIYAPFMIALSILQHLSLTTTSLIFIGGSGLLHLGYFVLLQRGYRAGDLSLVYPLARGTGPLLSTLIAIAALGERPGWVAIVGMLFVVAGVFVITGGPSILSGLSRHQGILYGLITGLFIATYTLWDKEAVSTFLVPPTLMYYCSIFVRLTLLTPYTVRHWNQVRAAWSTYRLEAFGIAVLSPLSYFLVLTALVFTPVSYIAPAREIGVLFGALMGTHLLAEGDAKRRLLAAGMIVLGVVALAI